MKLQILKSIRYPEDTFEKQVNLYFILIVTRGYSINKTFLVAFHNVLKLSIYITLIMRHSK
jgi:hypothetical protein